MMETKKNLNGFSDYARCPFGSKRPYPVLRSEQYQLERICVVKDTIEINGHAHSFTYVNYRNSVCVLPIYKEKVIVIEQYRHTLDSWELELPCGGIDEGETPENAASRELHEETGYQSGELTFLGDYYINQGYSSAMCSVFFTNCVAPGDPSRDETELIRIREKSVEEFESLIWENQFRFLTGIIAWEQAKHKKLI